VAYTNHSNSSERRSIAPRLAALFIAAFGFLPIANWIRGGHEAPWYATVAGGWATGSAIVIGIGLVLAILSRRATFLWRKGLLDGIVAFWRDHPRRAALVVSLLALAAYLSIARLVFSGRPLFIDELTQVLQAQIFAAGSLWRHVATHQEFFSGMLVADFAGRHFSQFPAGAPAMLVPGVLAGAPWISDPIWGAIAVMAFAAFARVAEPRPGVAMGATVLFAFAPLALFMSGTHMNHAPALMFITIAMAAMARVMTTGASRPAMALLNGLALGCAATVRPVDALAFALPAGAWYLGRALRDPKRWFEAAAAGAGVALPLATLLWVNSRTTGSPLLFGQELLWGTSHSLGFHAAPFGMAHTPARGMELINIYFLQLQTYLFETPLPSLFPAAAALALTRRFEALDRYLILSSALLVGLFFSFWHEGFYLGPRYVYLLLPLFALYTARFFPLFEERFGTGLAYRTAVYGGVSSAVMAAIMLVPLRAHQYGNSQTTMRWDPDAAAAAAHVDHAVVFVRESWGAQLIARLWALGISRSETERLYRSIDACVLDHALDSLESSGAHGTMALARLRPLLADSTRLARSPFSPDSSERYLSGLVYSAGCTAHIDADRDGFTLLMPLLIARGGANIYARDFGPRDSLLLREYPTRPIYLLRPPTTRIGDAPRFYPLSPDSLWRAWRAAPH
jgi:hypothetical protein